MSIRILATALIFILNTNVIHSQEVDTIVLEKIGQGVAEWRKDILERKTTYTNDLKELIVSLDTGSMRSSKKSSILKFITRDVEEGVNFNSFYLYDQLPPYSPYKNKYVERYVYLNQDFQIDKDLTNALVSAGLLTEKGTINRDKLIETAKDISFLDLKRDDKVLIFNGFGAEYAMLLAYTFQGMSMTIHNRYLQDHYLALDRADRYPNINNGNLIEFLHGRDPRLSVKNEQWDKIIMRETEFLKFGPGPILNSFHDNLSNKGFLYMLHSLKSDDETCPDGMKEEKIVSIARRANFKMVDKMVFKCTAYFKFRSVAIKK